MELIILLGMAGSGKSTVIHAFEDLGYMCVDNLPPSMLYHFVEQVVENREVKRVAVEMNVKYYAVEAIAEAISDIERIENVVIQQVFLEASEEALVSRYKETRRVHPLRSSQQTLQDAIGYERAKLKPLKDLKNTIVIDTSKLSGKQLHTYITDMFGDEQGRNLAVNFVSFGFKYGMPQDADFVIDVRFLKNPFYIDELKPQNGMDDAVYNYVFSFEESQVVYAKLKTLLDDMLSGFSREGRHHAVIAIGCTGGQHRSVSFARRLTAEYEKEYQTRLFNRDMYKNKH